MAFTASHAESREPIAGCSLLQQFVRRVVSLPFFSFVETGDDGFGDDGS